MPPERKALLQIHFCVLLWGFTAILGKLISLPALDLVWWRMLIVVVVLLAWPPLWRELRAVSLRTLAVFGGIGVVVALHWLTFYGAIKLANASVAATSMAVAPLFLAVIEPWIARRPFDARELAGGTGCAARRGSRGRRHARGHAARHSRSASRRHFSWPSSGR